VKREDAVEKAAEKQKQEYFYADFSMRCRQDIAFTRKQNKQEPYHEGNFQND